ncbi:MAG: hypothetical protein BGO01_03295 [Armatimonadetes bacterium 55-13]|nr:hypothetical protein [Armatimonadota bacterium]OJU62982.1 MAG: hypothetical protein BGO01_03295 [Armatimonadetes bacterium 55-13]
MKRSLPLAAILFLIAGCAEEPKVLDASTSFDLSLKPKTSQKFVYRMTTTGQDVTSTITSQLEVVGQSEGKTKFKQTFTDYTSNGEASVAKSKEALKKVVVDLTVSPTGEVEDRSVNGAEPGLSVPEENVLTLPNKEVKPGDEWPGGLSFVGQKASVQYHLKSFETVDGQNLANLIIDVKSMPGIYFDEPIRASVRVADGMIVKFNARLQSGDTTTVVTKDLVSNP